MSENFSIMTPVRRVLGFFLENGFRAMSPGPAFQRSADAQRRADTETARMVLYHFEGCPFCIKVRAKIQKLGLKVELRDIRKVPAFEKELMEGGGQYQVPCLRIHREDNSYQWMYESGDINDFLQKRFGA